MVQGDMINITLSLDEQLLERAQAYASQQNMALNGLIRSLLEQTLSLKSDGECAEFVRLAQETPWSSKGKKWRRGDLYDV